MKAMLGITCDRCGVIFRPGKRPNGIPNGFCFKLNDQDVALCADCVIEIGRMSEEEYAKDIEKWQ